MAQSSRIAERAMGIAMIQLPWRPAFSNDRGEARAAVQNLGRGFCVGRGSDVMFSKLWNRPFSVTFSSSSKRRTCAIPSSNRATDSSRETPKC